MGRFTLLTAFLDFKQPVLQEPEREPIQCLSILTDAIAQTDAQHHGCLSLRELLQPDPLNQLSVQVLELLQPLLYVMAEDDDIF